MAQRIIHFYKSEHKYFKKIKRGLALHKKITKHYAIKKKLACAKLQETLIEIQALKGEKYHENIRVLAKASQ